VIAIEEKLEVDGEVLEGGGGMFRVSLENAHELRTLADFQTRLQVLMDGAAASLTDEELAALRASVRVSRNGRRDRETLEPGPSVRARAAEILALLGAAAPELRPRETQALEDIVAGRKPKASPPPSVPVRMHRSGWPSR
jgi:hypothetical protein